MGFIEVAFARVTWPFVLLVIVGYVLAKVTSGRLEEQHKLRQTGGVRAPEFRGKLPWGIDLIINKLRASAADTNHLLWENMFKTVQNHTAEVRIIGKRIIFTDDPENIKAILATQFHDYGKGEPFHREFEPLLGDGIFATDGAQWHASRQLLRPQFNKSRISDLHTFEAHIQTLFTVMSVGGDAEAAGAANAAIAEGNPISNHSASEHVLDMADIFLRYTVDVATEFLLGTGTQSLIMPHQEFAAAITEVQRVQSMISRAGPAQGFVPRKTYNHAIRVIEGLISPYIDRVLMLTPEELHKTVSDHENGGQGRYNFLHALARFTRDRKVLRDQLIGVLLAGRDTTASTLSWAIYELSRNPKCVKRLRTEIANHIGVEGGTFFRHPSYEDLKAMKYLQHVISETLRLYPVLPYNIRMALKDTTLPRGGGPDGNQPVAILKNTPIAYSSLLMQRRPDFYPPHLPGADVFAPERWEHWHPKTWHYIPFNGGARVCIGQQFALTEMGYVLARLFQKFERVESHMNVIDHGSPRLKDNIVLLPGDGVKVTFYESNDKIGEKQGHV